MAKREPAGWLLGGRKASMVSPKLEQVFWWVSGRCFRINHWHRTAEVKSKEEILIPFLDVEVALFQSGIIITSE